MSATKISRRCWPVLCVLAFASASYSQNQPEEKVHVLYTGRLLGYFRVPDLQLRISKDCPDVSTTEPFSKSAIDFINLRKKQGEAILVGAGDNFSPELKSRVVGPGQPGEMVEGKDRFYWDESTRDWVKTEKASDKLLELLAAGKGTIPTDNVGCFLIRAGFSAVVPGRHDFYFGPERVRQLARFLATEPFRSSTSGSSGSTQRPVQMLGANIVMSTQWAGDGKPLSDTEKPPKFIPGFPSSTDLVAGNGLNLELRGLKDGGVVYPWFQGPTLKVAELDEDLIAQLRSLNSFSSLSAFQAGLQQLSTTLPPSDLRALSVQNASKFINQFALSTLYLCETMKQDPNGIDLATCKSNPSTQITAIPRSSGKTVELYLQFPAPAHQNGEHFSTVKPGRNHGLCLVHPHKDHSGADIEDTYCLRFSVRIPFFYFPETAPQRGYNSQRPGSYNDPEPYVLLEKDPASGRNTEVAIFGVIDPGMRNYVGALNFAWMNQAKKYNTVVTVEEPAEALQQQLSYFERKYEIDNHAKFTGVKILLAQMSPQHAQALAARLKKQNGTQEFQIVVSAADEEFSTGGEKTVISWTPPSQLGAGAYPNFLAVPEPYFSPRRTPSSQVSVGSLTITLPAKTDESWTILSNRLVQPEPVLQSTAPLFWQLVADQLDRECLGRPGLHNAASTIEERRDQIQQLSLCAIQKKLGADVALMQKRDFFTELPLEAGDIHNKQEKLQELVDRIIWKGDFLTLLYVPGSALQRVVQQSEIYDAEEASKLTLADQKQRGLVMAGLKKDPVATGQYLINEVPIDPKRLYAVATTDFIGAGDTGFEDFGRAAINPARSPREFDNKLDTISSVICRVLAGVNGNTYCLRELTREKYLDKIDSSPADARPRKTKLSELGRFLERLAFNGPGPVLKSTVPTSNLPHGSPTAPTVGQVVQERLIWDRSIQKLALSFSDLSSNLNDKQIDDRFRGTSEQGVTAKKTRTWDFDFQSRFVRSSHSHEFFLAPSARYKSQHTLDSGGQDLLNQIENVMKIDSGIAFQTRGELPRLATILSLHFETPTKLQQTSIELKTSTIDPITNVSVPDRLTFRQDRSFTLLPRLGLRWQNRVASFEGGIQEGGELNAVRGYRFTTENGGVVECIPDRDLTLEDCVTNIQSGITKHSQTTVLRDSGRIRGGLYWDFKVAVPITSILSYAWTDQGDYFPASLFSGAKVTDTLLRDRSKHQLKFTVFPSLSIGPAVQLLLYQNQVNRDFLIQKQFMFELEMSFNIFNWRKADKQIQYGSIEKK